ncbi:hypothetical protein ACQPZX_26150 [Actinoplanes sp. CA-142083]|uniref:hypothetical protein n=1 Tax=Actinoplanes sp. CA-142083 TaxID=3239903 RepID=UPI003D92DAE3
MDTVTDYWVEAAELERQHPLHWADAGNSRLFRVDFEGQEYLYKEYTEAFRSDADQHALGRLIAWRDTLAAHDRAHLDGVAAWPRFRVRHNGLLLGVLLPFAPERFYEKGRDDPRPRMLAQLIRLKADGRIRPGAEPEVKHAALGHAVEVLLWFHSHRVVINDVRELNVLCAKFGTDVFYVDCDVMAGPWRGVGPAAAPGYMAKAIPGLDRPTRETDIARLAWMAAAILLDDLALPEVREDQLRKVTDPAAARLLTTASRPGAIDEDGWRKLIDRWTAPRWTATAKVGGAAEAPPAPAPPLPPTRPVPMFQAESVGSTFKVPPRFRRPDPVYGLPPAPMLPAVVAPPGPLEWLRGRGRVLLVGTVIAVLALCGLVTLSMSLRGRAL